mmetsp:Transcript_40317/g.95812  ORF Transcript_40317/g.95812 Transcript_40317/m.95812 type:complete len:294 (+) Transcript_40317:75-956(+)
MRICRRVFVSDKAFTALPVRSPTKQPGWCTSSKPKQILLQKQLPTPTQALRVKLKNVRRPMWTCASAEASETSQSETPKPLEVFLGWATFNGVKGVGSADSKVALFESNEGERGLIAVKDIAEGEELVTVPLRIALTDHPEDEESNYLLYQDAPWSVRLAAKILREKAKGSNSPWKSYIDVLPTTILSPLTNFSWEEMLVSMQGCSTEGRVTNICEFEPPFGFFSHRKCNMNQPKIRFSRRIGLLPSRTSGALLQLSREQRRASFGGPCRWFTLEPLERQRRPGASACVCWSQ